MTLPTLARYADSLRYDRDRGLALALDWRAYPGSTRFIECGDVASVARAIERGAAWDRRTAGYLAGYGLALAARAAAGWPTDARRGAIIQAAEELRRARPAGDRLTALVEQALARADAALLAGASAEEAAAGFVSDAIHRADRVAERCGQIAAGLLDDGDRVIAHGFAGPALLWMLARAREEGKQILLCATVASADPESARLTIRLASEIGVPGTLLDDPAPERVFEPETPGLFVAGADRIALDGSVAGEAGTARYAALARRHGIPHYILGYDGPDPSGAPAGNDVTPPELISAIITSRGIYRPEMIARYLGDGDAPLDVISLSPN